MRSAATTSQSARIFSAHLSGLCSFFSTSTERVELLDNVVRRRLPRASQTKWNFDSRGVNTVYEHRKDLIDVMTVLENSEHVKFDAAIQQAGAYKHRLQDEDFVFWLTIFHEIMPHVEAIFEQGKNTDPVKLKQDLQHFENEICKIRDRIDQIVGDINLEAVADETLPRKKSRLLVSPEKRTEAVKMCDVVIQQIRTRFSFAGHLSAANLFSLENFAGYAKKFPESFVSEAVEAYPFLDRGKLKAELQFIYERGELRRVSGTFALLALVSQEDMRDIFQESRRLLAVLVTTPMWTVETGRCFSTLERIRMFAGNSAKAEGRVLSAEKAFVDNIENFNRQVIDRFACKKERIMNFDYCAM